MAKQNKAILRRWSRYRAKHILEPVFWWRSQTAAKPQSGRLSFPSRSQTLVRPAAHCFFYHFERWVHQMEIWMTYESAFRCFCCRYRCCVNISATLNITCKIHQMRQVSGTDVLIMWLLHNLVEASIDLFRNLLLDNQLKPRKLHSLVIYPSK